MVWKYVKVRDRPYEEPEGYGIKDWAIYVRIPYDNKNYNQVISWHSTELGAKNRLRQLGNKKLAIRLREGKEWDGIKIEGAWDPPEGSRRGKIKTFDTP